MLIYHFGSREGLLVAVARTAAVRSPTQRFINRMVADRTAPRWKTATVAVLYVLSRPLLPAVDASEVNCSAFHRLHFHWVERAVCGPYMLSYSSWRRNHKPVSLRPNGAWSSHWYIPQSESTPRS